MSEGVQRGLAHFYERWDGRGAPAGVAGGEVSVAQRVVTVAHDAVIYSRLEGPEAALEVIRGRRDAAYDPAVCDALLADTEVLRGGAGAGDPRQIVLGVEPEPVRTLPPSDLDDTARALGDFADLKAPFLMGHSRGVAELAAAAAAVLGCAPEVAGAEVEAGRLDQRAVNAVLEAGGQRPVHIRDAFPAGLSDREVEVLRLLSRGKTNREIATTLVIAPKTVGRHVENIYAKLGVSTRAGAALFTAEHALLD